MTKLQVIYTTAKGQFLVNINIELIDMTTKIKTLRSLKVFFSGKFSFLPDTWVQEAYYNASLNGKTKLPEDMQYVPEISQISMCIITPNEEKYNAPKWYNECHGKVYIPTGS